MTKFLKQIIVGGIVMVAASRFAKLLDLGIDKAVDAVKPKPEPEDAPPQQ